MDAYQACLSHQDRTADGPHPHMNPRGSVGTPAITVDPYDASHRLNVLQCTPEAPLVRHA